MKKRLEVGTGSGFFRHPFQHIRPASFDRRSTVRFLLLGWLLVSLIALNGDAPLTSWDWAKRVLVGFGEILLFAYFLKRLRPSIWRDNLALALLGLVATISLLAVRAVSTALGEAANNPTLGVLIVAGLPAGAMLIGALMSPSLAIVMVAIGSLGLAASGSFGEAQIIVSCGAAWTSVLVMSPLKNRSGLIRGAIALTASMAALSAFVVGDAGHDAKTILIGAAWGGLAGVAATALFWLGIALLERPFRLDTPMALYELSSPDSNLLRQLREEAPGTFAHSQNVAMMAEAAALAIGADPLLARVGGLYHDIGKLKRPGFFIENQVGYNTHGKLTPNLSAVIIAAHVKDGVELAHENRLPLRVCEIIGQHHGTCLITYFYHQAIGSGEPDPILEQHFRYEGPKPRTKEAALVLLADTVEAAGRCLEAPTPSRISNLVQDLVEMRRSDGQLDDSELSFGDLPKIKEAFIKTLSAIHHQRVDYAGAMSEDYAYIDSQ